MEYDGRSEREGGAVAVVVLEMNTRRSVRRERRTRGGEERGREGGEEEVEEEVSMMIGGIPGKEEVFV